MPPLNDRLKELLCSEFAEAANKAVICILKLLYGIIMLMVIINVSCVWGKCSASFAYCMLYNIII